MGRAGDRRALLRSGDTGRELRGRSGRVSIGRAHFDVKRVVRIVSREDPQDP